VPSDPTRRRRAAASLAALSVLAALATVVAFAVAVHTATGRRLDDAARGDVSLSAAPRAFAATQRLLETISVSSLALFGIGIMGIALLRRRPWLAVGAGVVVLGANITTQLMKTNFSRPDPAGWDGTTPGAFPSGHVTVAMSLGMSLVLVAPPALRWTATLVGCAYATGVGVAVIALDWHRPSEVVGAYLVSVAWTAAVGAILTGTGEGGPGEGDRGPGGTRLGALAAAVLGLSFAVVVGTALAQRVDLVRVADDRTAFAVASLVVAATCIALGAMVASLLQRAQIPPPGAADR